jgi:HD-GYP domain-containing protein (c-di-GMP phosphodiesterase class II)
MQIVDVYDALTAKRPYRPALPRAEALQIMDAEVKKGWWDSGIVQEFCQMPMSAAAASAGR